MYYKIDWLSDNGVAITYTNNLDAENINKAQNAIYTSPNSYNLRYIIYDYSDVKNLTLSQDEEDLIVAIDCAATYTFQRQIKLALIGNDVCELFIINFIKHFNELCEVYTWDVKAFNDLNVAKQWLSVNY